MAMMAKFRAAGRYAVLAMSMTACSSLSQPRPAWAAGPDEAAAPAAIDDLPNPPELVSKDGVLTGTLTIAPTHVRVRGRDIVSNVVNGNFMAPTLRVLRGDTIKVKAVNQIAKAQVNIDGPEPTNIHYHGMDVSPIPPGDSVFVRIQPNKQFNYNVYIPTDHPQGLHWYHAHVHHFVEDQIGSGVSGMLIVDGFIQRQYPELAGLRQRVMVLKDFVFPGFKDGEARTKSLNGYANPPIQSRPGEFQIWEIGNLGADAFFDLKLAGHAFWVLERDGNLLLKPVRQDHLFLPAGARATVVVQTIDKRGTYPLRSVNVDTGPQGDPNPTVQIGTFTVAGKPVGGGEAILARLRKGPADAASIEPNPNQLRKAAIARTRYIDFSETPNGDTFFINRKTYDENRVDTTVRLGETERWIVRNFSGEMHVFHLHQTEFLVDKFSGTPDQTLGLGMRDVINIPYAKGGKPGVAELIIPFTNPVMVGEFVYHCHIVGHEDAGMMANISVLPKKTLAQDLWDRVTELAGLEVPPLLSRANADEGAVGQALLADLDANICRSRTPEQAATPWQIASDHIPPTRIRP
jgi:suppressor of ftsI